MKQTIDMPVVQECDAVECAYNNAKSCHAHAITVGDGTHPACDTYFPRAAHVQSHSEQAGVGACKVSSCRHNIDLECSAPLVQIGHHSSHADCFTYAPA